MQFNMRKDWENNIWECEVKNCWMVGIGRDIKEAIEDFLEMYNQVTESDVR